MNKWMRWFCVLVLGSLLAAGCRSAGPVAVAVTPVPTIDPTERQLRVFDSLWAAVRDQYVREDFNGVDWHALGAQYRARVEAGQNDEAFASTVQEMLAALPDSQASYETRTQRLTAETADRRIYHGIGAFIAFRERPEPHVIILSLVSDSPAERAGLLPHDTIHAVDGQPFTLADAARPSERIRGAQDSQVTLSVQTAGQPRRDIVIQRAEIRAADVLRGGYYETLDMVYYRVPVAAERNLADTIANDLASITQTHSPRGIILDLRVARSGNGTWPLTAMLKLFANGALGEFYTRQGVNELNVAGRDVGGSQSLPLIVLVGPDTQGSPEVFAGALQSAGRAVLLGLPTPGSVEGFTSVHLPDGSRLFLATSSFRTASSLDLADAGVFPDQVVDADWGVISTEHDPTLNAAIALLGSGDG
jgi:carboxyl-terminal processing protease